MSTGSEWVANKKDADALRFAPLKSEEEIAKEVREYLGRKKKEPYTGRLCGRPGEEHKAGGPSASRRGRFATGGAR